MSDPGNNFSVSKRRERILVMALARRFPTVDAGPLDLSPEEALYFSIYLELVADPTGEERARLKEQMQNI